MAALQETVCKNLGRALYMQTNYIIIIIIIVAINIILENIWIYEG
jgi:hypothetical protein